MNTITRNGQSNLLEVPTMSRYLPVLIAALAASLLCNASANAVTPDAAPSAASSAAPPPAAGNAPKSKSAAGKHAKSDRPAVVQPSFATPDDAVKALADAMHSDNVRTIFSILGPGSSKWILSGDPVEDNRMRDRFDASYEKSNKLDRQGDDKVVLLLGENEFPFPFPLVKRAAGWQFDARSGADEVLNRRIGRNELAAMQVCLAYVDAQREYVQQNHNNSGLPEYAQKLTSSPGKQDGLYWQTSDGDPPSPLGPLAEQAKKRGYGNELDAYHGYRYKILAGQGKDAPGGAYSYLVKGKMIGGFAMVAYPSRWNASGVMTFVCNHDGAVYQSNLGPDTKTIAPAMSLFNPGEGWEKTSPE